MAVPTAALVVLAGTGVMAQLVVYRDADATVSKVQLELVVQGFVHELQRERGLTNGLLGGQRALGDQVKQQRQRVDEARDGLDRALRGSPPEASTPVISALDNGLKNLNDVRARVDGGLADRTDTLNFFTAAITQLNRAGSAGQTNLADAALLRSLDALRTLGDAKEATALERGFLNGVLSAGAFHGQEYTRFSEIRADKLAGLSAFSGRATDTQQAALDGALHSPAAGEASVYELRAIDGPGAAALKLSAPTWWADMTRLVDDLRAVQQKVGADVEARAAELRAEALALLVLYIAVAVGALAVATALGVMAARSITRPLRLLATDAHDAVTARLPDMVTRIQAAEGVPAELRSPPEPVLALEDREDEIGEVSRALNEVQRTAVGLASEQAQLRHNAAESLSNLARRNQNLVRRQLGFISDLERDESDPTALANLFELDHLATRMRRNAESLLILVGERTPRQWNQPVPITDVVRAALSEVEEYRRVGLRRMDEALVLGTVGTELVHLLAELMENALSFSPPDREVEIYGQRIDTGYVIAVLDHGIGMSVEDLAQANARLRGEERFLVTPTRLLGHFVVGRLARHLGVDVQLHESPLTGITARVTLPMSLLALSMAIEAPVIPGLRATAPPKPPAVPMPRPFHLDHDPGPAAARVAVLERPATPPPTHPPSQPPTPAPGSAPTRTRNGLVKRVRATANDADSAAADEPGPVVQQPAESSGRSPADVRATLTDFRAGFQRKREDHADAVGTSNPAGDEADQG
ncbi:MAG TPA: nitrate- and nitrite sensing domain-containing protein [Pseudonocardiaceae bacterium]